MGTAATIFATCQETGNLRHYTVFDISNTKIEIRNIFKFTVDCQLIPCLIDDCRSGTGWLLGLILGGLYSHQMASTSSQVFGIKQFVCGMP